MAKITVILAVLAAFLLVTAHAQSTPCPCVCRRNRDPVCTENQHGVTKVYDNECRVECANRCDNAGAVEVEKSKCGLPDD
ncbi:hypothetical protein B566_EDAN007101 [Ephemera danica]|nr:hypothetical protein B566_EDAN007101 [Ephemera danica]